MPSESDPEHTAPRRIPRGLLITGGIMLLAGAGIWALHASLTYTAAVLWQEAGSKLKAAGESLEQSEAVPRPVPDQDNFFALEPLKEITSHTSRASNKTVDLLNGNIWPRTPPRQLSGVGFGVPWHAAAWASAYRSGQGGIGSQDLLPPDNGSPGRVMLAALDAYKELLDTLHSGVDRPVSKLAYVSFASSTHPNAPVSSYDCRVRCVDLVHLLAIHAQSAVACGEVHAAALDIRAALRIAEAQGGAPHIFAIEVTLAVIATIEEPLWSLLKSRQMSMEDLRSLERDLARLKIDEWMGASLRVMLSGYGDRLALQRIGGNQVLIPRPYGSAKTKPLEFARYWMRVGLLKFDPPAVARGNRANAIQALLDYQLVPLRREGLLGLWNGALRIDHDLGSKSVHTGIMGHRVFQDLPPRIQNANRALQTQIHLHQARLACALERYFLAHQRYPERLDELVPECLDRLLPDLMDGKSMRYAKTEQGRYKLWSLGFDGHDDGGDLRPHPSGNDEPLMWDKNYPGDWVWSYEPLVPAKP